MIIRSVQEPDLTAFKALRLEALREHPEAFGTDYEESLREEDSFWIGRVHAALDGPGQRIFIADVGDQLAGMLGVHRSKGVKNEHAGNIWGVYVRPNFRGQGLTGQMMRRAIEPPCTSRPAECMTLQAGCVLVEQAFLPASARCTHRAGSDVGAPTSEADKNVCTTGLKRHASRRAW